MKTTNSVNMTEGPFAKKIIFFAIPLLLTGILQTVYNAADSIVVGRFVGHTALAAVSSNGALCNLIIGLFIGMAVGSGVVIAKYIGAGRENAVSRSVHTAMLFGVVCGIIVMIIGLFVARPCLKLMGSPDDVIDLATLYLKIIFIGSPGNITYNFGAAVLRSKGDTKRPLIILSVAGIINVVLNLFFVIVFNMSVAGVAIATIISQYVSAIWVVILLFKEEGSTKLHFSKIKFYKEELLAIISIGLPAGIQSVLFALSNVVIQAAVNSFGSTVVAGCSAGGNVDSILYLAANALTQATMTFTSQNMGAKRIENVKRVYGLCLMMSVVSLLVLSTVSIIYSPQIMSIFSEDTGVIAAGVQRIKIVIPLYFICGLMDIGGGQIRGMGRSFTSMVVTLMGSCVFRLAWVFVAVPFNRTIFMVYLAYPISWAITAIVHNIMYFAILRKIKREGA